MNELKSKEVLRSWAYITGLSPLRATAVARKAEQTQPYLLAFILQAGEASLDQPDRELLLSLTFLALHALARRGERLPLVSAESLSQTLPMSLEWVKSLQDDSPEDTQTAATEAFLRGRQPALLGIVMEILLEENVDEHSMAVIIACLRTVIDCLDAGTR